MLRLRKGYVRIHICGGAYERFFNLCAGNHVFLWNLCPVEKGYEANIYAKDFKRLRPLSKKCRTRIRIKRKYGFPFFINRHRKRKAFLFGFVFCGFFIFLLSQFIWRITIDGNVSISRQTFLEYLAEDHVTYGTKKRSIDCKQLAADIRTHFPDVIWVSVKMEGTSLSLRVQENTDTEVYTDREYEASDLVADVDGIVEKMITRKGLPVVFPGEEVKKGDILVTGKMEITDDAGEVASTHYTAADADIYIRTALNYEDCFPMNHQSTEYTGEKRYGAYVKIFGKFFGFDGGTDHFKASDIINKEQQLHILKDFYLPLSVGTVCAREYHYIAETYSKEEAKEIAEKRLQKFLSEKEEKGVQIFENNVKIDISAILCRTHGTITVVKKAGARSSASMSKITQEGTNN